MCVCVFYVLVYCTRSDNSSNVRANANRNAVDVDTDQVRLLVSAVISESYGTFTPTMSWAHSTQPEMPEQWPIAAVWSRNSLTAAGSEQEQAYVTASRQHCLFLSVHTVS